MEDNRRVFPLRKSKPESKARPLPELLMPKLEEKVKPLPELLVPKLEEKARVFTPRQTEALLRGKRKRLAIVTACYNLPEWLPRLCQSLRAGSLYIPEFYIYLHSRNNALYEAALKEEAHGDAYLFPHGFNRGLAKSWNDGILEAYSDGVDFVLVTNDDIEFGEGGADRMVREAIEGRDNFAIFTSGRAGRNKEGRAAHNWSCFILMPIALEKVGCFDENFFPALYEDLDYFRRMNNLHLNVPTVQDNVWHGGSLTSSTDFRLGLKRRTFEELNRRYYLRKWKGFNCPFGDKRFDFYIDPLQRANPYPGYNRKDYDDICT